MRIIATAGWSIHPLGCYYGYLLGAVDETLLNFVYTVAVLVNGFAFMLACRSAAKAISMAMVISVRAHTELVFDFEVTIVEECILLVALWDISINYTIASGKLNLAISSITLLTYMRIHLLPCASAKFSYPSSADRLTWRTSAPSSTCA